jgi:signal transduction histidine kinase
MDDEPDKVRELERIALDNTNRLHLLINDILDVDKLESGRMDYRFSHSDLSALVQQVVTANDTLAYNAAVKLVFMPHAVPLLVHMDPDRIFQVLTNIIANAIKFAHPGSSVTVSLSRAQSSVVVSVHNLGEVITEEDRSKMFTKFFQRDSSTTRAKGGTGLGLYISQKILDSHQSRLDFISTPEAGTTFFFALPTQPR